MNIDIKNIDDSVITSVVADNNAIFHEELMTSDYINISWKSDENVEIPAGVYIEYEGEKYRLLEPYNPTQQDECTYNYSPQFKSRVMSWDKQITPVYTYQEDGVTVKSRDMDWDFTGSPADAMFIVKQAIKNETGEEWTIEISDSLPATITISSQSSSIFSIINSIASECKTEWWADKKTNTLYLSKCIFGNPITLEVGNNINIPSVQTDKKGYFTRFFAFGSTRNITQGSSQGNAVINNRLTLNPSKYPLGYKDIKEGLKKDEIFPTTLYFEDIYPSSKLTISDVRARLRYRLDNAGQRIQIGGTNEEPVYEQYAIWYFQIADFKFDPTTIIEGKNLSASFKTGQLASRDFELTYHENAETVSDTNDVTPFEIKAGDYEIIIDETIGQIIPGVAYIIPQNGDMVILYNIEMPAEYTASAQDELEKELDKAIASQIEDTNSYQFSSDPTRFYENNIDVKMGQSVTFINENKTLSTRVMMVEKRLDYSFYQNIKIGNKIIKGNTQQLKEEVASVNQNIDVIKAFNELSASLSQAYANAQREMIEGFAAIKNLWTLETDENGEKYAYTKYNVLTQGGVTQYSAGNSKVPSVFDGLPLDNQTIWKNPTTGKIEVIAGAGSSFDENAMWSALATSNSEKQIDKSHITTALTGFATESWVSQNYATASALASVSNKLNDFLEGSDTDNIINKWKELETFLSGMAETDNLAEILKSKADKSYVDSTFVTLATKQTITGEKTFSSVLNTAAIKASGAITAPSLAVSDWVTIAGIKLRKLEDGALMLEGNLALTGALTMYASNGQSFDTIYDGLPIDNDTIYWQEVEGSRVLKAREGSGSSFDKSAMWAALEGATTEQINKTHLTTALNGYATESWVTSKNYLTSVSIATISDLHANWDALLKAAPSAYVTRWPTISEVTGKQNLIVKLNGGTTEGTNQFTYNATGAKTINITPAGIGAYTKSESDSKYPTKTGSGASGTWGINVTGNAGSATKLQTARTLWGQSFDGTQDVSGDMNNVGKISANGEIITSSANSFRAAYGSYGFFIRNDGVSTYFMHTNSGDPYGGCNNNRPITIDNASGRISINSALDVGSVTTFYNKITGTSISCSDWHRSTGQTGWVNDSYGGGIYMTDATWVRVWNGKGFLCENTIESSYRISARQLVNVYGAFGYGWGSGQAAFQVAIPTNENQTPILLAYNGVNGNQTGNDRYFAIEVLNTGLRNVHFNVRGSELVRMVSGQFEVNGNLLVTGGGTFYSSDIRYKSIIQQTKLSLSDIAKAPSFIYHWNKEGMNCDRLNLGGSAQYTQSILPWAVENSNNFLSMDYATVAYTFAVHTARHLLTYESRTDKKIKKLENRVKYLEKQLKKLGYEEVRTLDDQSV